MKTDASDHSISGIVFQKNGLIGILSKKLSPCEALYPIQEKETLAAVLTITYFRYILLGSKIRLRTDNKNMLSLNSAPNKRTTGWLLVLQEFDIELEYIRGQESMAADFISRLQTLKTKEKMTGFPLDLKKISEGQQKVDFAEDTNTFLLTYYNNIPLKLDKNKRIIIPKSQQEEIVKNIHNFLVHAAAKKCYYSVKDFINGENLKKIFGVLCRTCMTCKLNRKHTIKYGHLPSAPTGSKPFEPFYSDIMGPYPSVEYKTPFLNFLFYIVTVVDAFSMLVRVFLTEDTTGRFLVEKVLSSWIAEFEAPRVFVCDQGPQYMSAVFRSYLQQSSIRHFPTSGYNACGNGKAERLNSTINFILKTNKGNTVKELKEKIENCFNEGFHRITQTTPNSIVQLARKLNPLKLPCLKTFEQINTLNETAALENQKRTNRICQPYFYNPGDAISLKSQENGKAAPIYLGPFVCRDVSRTGSRILIEEPSRITWHNIRNVTPFWEEGRMSGSN